MGLSTEPSAVTMGGNTLAAWLLLLALCPLALAIKCWTCDGVKGGGGLCEGDRKMGEEVECDQLQNCGLLQENRLTMKHGSVVSTDTRWRRGCASDGSELLVNSGGAEAESVEYLLGCQNMNSYSYDDIVVRFQLCVCNSTLCDTRPQDIPGSATLDSSSPYIVSLLAGYLLLAYWIN